MSFAKWLSLFSVWSYKVRWLPWCIFCLRYCLNYKNVYLITRLTNIWNWSKIFKGIAFIWQPRLVLLYKSPIACYDTFFLINWNSDVSKIPFSSFHDQHLCWRECWNWLKERNWAIKTLDSILGCFYLFKVLNPIRFWHARLPLHSNQFNWYHGRKLENSWEESKWLSIV